MSRLILLIVLILVSVAAAFYTWRTQDSLEGFEEEEAYSVIADGGSDYAKRVYVMKLFDVLLKRKATTSELDEFSSVGSDTEILSAVIARYPSRDQPTDKATVPVPVPVPVPVADTKQELMQHLKEISDRVAKSHVLLQTI